MTIFNFCLVLILIFLEYQFAHVNYFTNQQVTLDHIFIRDWDPVREVHAYPPATGKLAAYSREDILLFMDFTIRSWLDIETNDHGPLFRNSSLWLCVEHYNAGTVTRDLMYTMNTRLEEHCIILTEDQGFNNSKDWLLHSDLKIPWKTLENLKLNFSLSTITLHPLGPSPEPDCFKLHVSILFNNKV